MNDFLKDKSIVNFVVTLKSGGDFEPYDAITLSRQVYRNLKVPHRFICCTDYDFDDPYIDILPLERNLPGWWSMIEMFRVYGPVIASGLDLIVVNNIDRLAEIALTCPKDVFYMARPQPLAQERGVKWCSGFQIWNGNWDWLYTNWHDKQIGIFKTEQKRTYTKLIDRGFEIRAVQDYFDGYYSFKNDCRGGLPKDAKTVLFHGDPRPKDCKEKWVQEIYGSIAMGKHPFECMVEERDVKFN